VVGVLIVILLLLQFIGIDNGLPRLARWTRPNASEQPSA
jgi:hypothetical protein